MNSKKIGIVGGGQLGRMSALAAARLGVSCVIYTPEENSPASQVAYKTIVGKYEDKKLLKKFASEVDVISYEFENIPIETMKYLETMKPVYPEINLLEISQHRVKEKQFLNGIGIPTAMWRKISCFDEISSIFEEWNTDRFIIKTCRFGYDGKGQIRATREDLANGTLQEKFTNLRSDDLIAEEIIDFACEISVIIARDKIGQIAVYEPSLNEHRNHILFRSTVPAIVPDAISEMAIKYGELLAEAVDLVGVMGLELFVGKNGTLLANEIAPRTHNSGHWTIDACACSQFENHIRTVCGMNVGDPSRHSNAVMVNLIGDEIKHLPKFMEIKATCVHDYGKVVVRNGRKMGHVTMISEITEKEQQNERCKGKFKQLCEHVF